MQKTRTSPYRPQSDGLVERFNRTLQQMLASYVNENRNDWDDHLPYMCMAYRSTVHESTKFSPNRLMLGREVNLPLDIMIGAPPSSGVSPCYVQYVEWVKHAIIVLYNMVVQLFFFFFSFLSCHASMRRYGSRIPTIF